MVPQRNDREFLERVCAFLRGGGHEVWVFGGWAEELLGLVPPREHADVDLLYRSASFDRLDPFVVHRGLTEIPGKRFPHKRAFLLDTIVVELLLVEEDDNGFFTRFWSIAEHRWPHDVFDSTGVLPTASAASLVGHRMAHDLYAFERFHPTTLA